MEGRNEETQAVDPARKLNDCNPKLVEAVGIEQPAAHPIPTILKRFRGQVSTRTRPKNTSETRCRTFLWQCHKSLMWIGSLRRLARCSGCWMCSGGAADA